MPATPDAAWLRLILVRRLRPLLRRIGRVSRRSPLLNRAFRQLLPGAAEPPPKAKPGRELASDVRGVTLDADHRFTVTGWAFRHRSKDLNPTAITLIAVGPPGTEPLSFPTRLAPNEDVNRSDVDRANDRSGATFVAQLDPAALTSAGPSGDHRWRIEVRIEDSLGAHQEPFGGVTRFGTAGAVGTATVGPRLRTVGAVQADGEGLVLAVHRPPAWVRDLELDGDRLRIRIGHSGRFWPRRAFLVQRSEARVAVVGVPGNTTRLGLRPPSVRGMIDLDLDQLRDHLGHAIQGRWTIGLVDPTGRQRMLRWDTFSERASAAVIDAELAARGLRVLSSPGGLFRLEGGAEAVQVVEAEVLTGPDRLRLTVTGLAPGTDFGSVADLAGRFWLDSDQQRVAATTVRSGPGGLIVEFVLLGQVPFGPEMRPLMSGRYVFGFDRGLVSDGTAQPSADPQPELISAAIGSGLTGRLGERTELDRLSVRIERSGQGEFALRISAPRLPGQAGRFQMMRLATEFRPGPAGSVGGSGHRALSEPLAPAVLFDCFDGQSTGDNPRAIQRELLRRRPDLVSSWVVGDHAVAVPDRSVPVIWNSRAHFEARARAQFVVTNCWLGADFRARPGQRVMQTWHGTPLKRMGLDRIGVDTSEAYRADLIEQTRQWTWLISQNPYSTEIFTRAYGLDEAGVELAEIGYPRDDALSLDPDPARIEAIRARLGLAAGDRAVLFAPTWRENGRATTSGLDFVRLRARLGPNWKILVRGHANTVNTENAVRATGVVDVTRYPEITDLFAVAELMITDYSSVMFDFTITGKPMTFFVPDLIDYAKTLRGTYFDLGETAPGPLVTTTDGVADEIERAADGVPSEYTERYRAWTARFNPFDDGHATQRAVDLLLSDLD